MVSQQVVWRFLNSVGGLRIICHPGSQTGENRNHYRLFSGRHSTYHASGTSTPFFQFRNDGRILDARGLMIDSIEGLGRAYFEHDISSIPEHALI